MHGQPNVNKKKTVKFVVDDKQGSSQVQRSVRDMMQSLTTAASQGTINKAMRNILC
jgi:hypothetical protein